MSRARICREALALVDEEGLDALSMRHLGARLGVEAMSLYRHVHDKSDLLDSLQGAVLAELRPPKDTGLDWRALLLALSKALRAALLRHPNVVSLFATRPMRGPEADRVVTASWSALERAGFSPADARKAIIAVGVFTIGHTLGEAHGQPAAHLGAPAGPGAAEFHFGIDALLDGIARHAKGAKPARARTHGKQRHA